MEQSFCVFGTASGFSPMSQKNRNFELNFKSTLPQISNEQENTNFSEWDLLLKREKKKKSGKQPSQLVSVLTLTLELFCFATPSLVLISAAYVFSTKK
jgi:hypothetical protein